MPLPIAKLGSPEYSIRLAGIEARHSSARPKPAANPAWANAQNDIGELLRLYKSLAASHAELLSDIKAVKKACRPDWSIDDQERVDKILEIARAAIAKATG